ncbi:MAG: class I SAM-dependent methyltransferase [Coprothermobacter sp.]|nr:class I SAM-dependent methyltransferase [Coprothermobacter sp.]
MNIKKIAPFEKHAKEYDAWFDENKLVYLSELEAVKSMLPEGGMGIEIGVGTGRFASQLGIKLGLEPSKSMASLARQRGIEVVEGVAEALPFQDGSFDFVLMVTVICFLNDVEKALSEACRVLKPGGCIIIAFIDKNSPIGKTYEQYKNENVFYKEATFYSVEEVTGLLQSAGFKNLSFCQTVFQHTAEDEQVEKPEPGYGKGSFVVVRAEK